MDGVPYLLILPLLAPLIMRAIAAARSREDEHSRELESRLTEAEDLILAGQTDEAAKKLVVAAPLIDKVRDSGKTGQSSRFYIAEGLIAKAFDERPAAEAALSKALLCVDAITDPRLEANLRARAQAERVSLGEKPDDVRQRTEQALSHEPKADDPWTLSILAWVAARMGSFEQAAGQWQSARHHWEEAMRIAERIPTPGPSGQSGWTREKEVGLWADGRAAGAHAAMGFADALFGLHDREGAERCLVHAEQLLEGPDHALTLSGRASVLFRRANAIGDSLATEADQTALYERAVVLGDAARCLEGTWIAGKAECWLGQSSVRSGDHARGLQRFEAVLARVQDIDRDVFRSATIEMLMLIADTHAVSEAWEPAAAALRRALDLTRGSAEMDSRDLTVQIIHKLHGCALHRKALAEGRDLMGTLASMLPAISANAHQLATLLEPHMLGSQLVAESRLAEADEAFARAESVAREGESGYWERQAAFQRGMLALRHERPADAREHLNRALSIRVVTLSAAQESSERADVLLRLAECDMGAERHESAERLLIRAAEEGVASGRAHGRHLAAIASWLNAGLPQHEMDERRRLLDAAARLGRLSGTDKGRELAAKAEGALKEMGL